MSTAQSAVRVPRGAIGGTQSSLPQFHHQYQNCQRDQDTTSHAAVRKIRPCAGIIDTQFTLLDVYLQCRYDHRVAIACGENV